MLAWHAKRNALAQRMHERALAALVTAQKLLPLPAAAGPVPVAASVGAAAEREDPTAEIGNPAPAPVNTASGKTRTLARNGPARRGRLRPPRGLAGACGSVGPSRGRRGEGVRDE